MRMMELTEEIEHLDGEKMTEDKFWGLAALDEDEDFEYGRDFIKEGSYDALLKSPYYKIPLFIEGNWFRGITEQRVFQVGGMLRGGLLSTASLKC